MGAFFTALLGRLAGLAGFTGALAVAAFAAAWLLGTDLGAWLFEQVLGVAIMALNSFSLDPELFNPGSYIDALPVEVTNMLGLLRIGECIAIIAGAVLVKITLQLIPFTRLGS